MSTTYLLLSHSCKSAIPWQYLLIAKPRVCSITFDITLLKLLEPFSQVPFPEPGCPTGATLRFLYGASLMSTIWTYRAAYGIRHDYWLMQGCFAAGNSVADGLVPGSIQVDTFAKACRVLYEAGDRLPLANQLLLSIKKLLRRRRIQFPEPTRQLFSALANRSGATYLKGAWVVPVATAQGTGTGVGLNLSSFLDVTFSNVITGINALDN